MLLALALNADSGAGLRWTPPANWKSEAQRPMRLATYTVPPAAGDHEGAECGVFYFGQGQGGSVDANMDRWIGQVPAVLNVWFPGEEGGPAIAGVLFGDTNPSGHTPITFPHRIEDSPSFGNYPGTDGVVNYAEGVYVGYRHYDTKNVEPLFCFGHGLSYTRFEYKDLKISAHKTTLTVRNVGPRDGADVVQFYVHPLKPSVDRPVQELKGFRRTYLRRGEAVTVEFPLDSSMFSWYDGSAKKWVADPGAYELRVGSSSRDIRLKGNYELK